MLEYLEKYTVAQKGVGTYFIVFGVVFFFFTMVIRIVFGRSVLLTGLNWGSFSSALFLTASGIIYRAYCDMIHRKAAAALFENESEFIKSEYSRMGKVEKDFKKFQIAFSALAFISVIIGIFIHSRTGKGVFFAFAILFVGMLAIEYYSRNSIKNYSRQLYEEMTRVKKKYSWEV